MPFNGNGVFNRLYNWENDAANGINIRADRMDDDTDDITANGLGNCLTRDGQGAPTGNLNMEGYRWTNAGDAVANQDYVTLKQLSTIAGVNRKLVDSNYTILASDGVVECNAAGGTFTIIYPVGLIGVRPMVLTKVDATYTEVVISDGTNQVGSLFFPPNGSFFQSYQIYSNGSKVRLT